MGRWMGDGQRAGGGLGADDRHTLDERHGRDDASGGQRLLNEVRQSVGPELLADGVALERSDG
jgi:hypothetical protein